MRWVAGQLNADRPLVVSLRIIRNASPMKFTFRSQVVFDVTRTVLTFGFNVLKLGKNCFYGLAHHIGQHVESPSMRHPKVDVGHAMAGGRRQGGG